MEGEDKKIREFLLGSASEKNAEEVGLRLFADPGFDEKMSFAEEELIEDFLDDLLPAEESELFKRNFLITPKRRDLLREIAQWRRLAHTAQARPAQSKAEEKKPRGLFDGLREFLSLNLRPVAAVLLVLVLGGVAWRVFFYQAGLSSNEEVYARLNAKDLNTAPEIVGLSNRSLIPGTMRSAGEAGKLNFAALTENVLFRLALPAGTPPDARFNLELVKGEETIFRQNDLRVYQNPNGQELKVILPKAVLPKGAYQIKLNDGASYALAVE
jgi:hypothetical protein